MVPSALRSLTTSRGPRRTARTGAGSALRRRALTGVAMGSSVAYRLRRPLLEKGLEPRLRLVVALGDRRDQRLGDIAASGIGVGNPRQHVGDGEIGHGRIAGNTLRELDAFGETGAGGNEIVRDADRLAFLGAIGAAGEHHVDHLRGAVEGWRLPGPAGAHES